MRNIEPPLGRGSATKCFDIFFSLGAIASMKALIGACTESRKRCLFSSNQPRSLCVFNSRKKAKKSFGKPAKVSGIARSVLLLDGNGCAPRPHLFGDQPAA